MNNVRINAVLFLLILSFFACQTSDSKSAKSEAKSSKKEKVVNKEANDSTKEKFILFFGNSLTAGYGLKEEEAFTAHIQSKIDELNLDYKVVNAGLSGETTAGGKGRINWVLKQPVDVFVLELGGNDMLRGLPFEETEKNLRAIFQEVRKKKPEAKLVLAGMMAPPNMGQDYAKGFSAVYPKLAKEFEAAFIPFLLDGVAGDPKLNQADGIHPTAAGQKIVAENVWKVLKPLLY